MTAADVRPDRTYTVPFDAVWRIAISLAEGGLSGWRLKRADDRSGVIEARREPALLRREVVVRIRIGLDENAQTRVDLEAHGVDGREEPRACRRAVTRFLDRLDADVARVDVPRAPTWSS